MVATWIFLGVGLILLGLIIAFATDTKASTPPAHTAPRLPPRTNVVPPSRAVTTSRTAPSRTPAARPLPPRRSPASATAGATTRTAPELLGPRGIRPHQFPCCPYDKQRNRPGGPLLIRWDSEENCYLCSRHHRFKSNGKPLLS